MLHSGDHGVRTLNYSSSPLSLCAYTIPRSCSHTLVATPSSHTHTHIHIPLHVCATLTLLLNLALMAASSRWAFQPLRLYELIFTRSSLALLLSLLALSRGLWLRASTSRCLRETRYWWQLALDPQVTGSRGMRTQGFEIGVRGLSTSHYLVAAMHLTHSSLGDSRSEGKHREYKPQSPDCRFELILCAAPRTTLKQNNVRRKDKTPRIT